MNIRMSTHYSVVPLGRSPLEAMEALRSLFPDGRADDLNMVMFGTSGVHGHYTSLDDVAGGLEKYGDDAEFEDWPDDYAGDELTVLVVHPRTVCLRYGNIRVRKADLPWLRTLHASSGQCFTGWFQRGEAERSS